MISQRTKAALAAAKARGVKLGNPNGAAHLRAGCLQAAALSAARRMADALQRDRAVAPTLTELTAAGVTGARRLAYELNIKGVPAPSGGIWSAGQVRAVARRLG